VIQPKIFTPPKYFSGGYYKGDGIERLHCENLFVIKASFDCEYLNCSSKVVFGKLCEVDVSLL